MNTLDSPLEALALNYLSYGFFTALNSIWASLAVVATAISFWKIKAKPEPLSRSKDVVPIISSPEVQNAVVLSSAPTTKSPFVLEREHNTKVKFTLHYNEDNFREGDEGGDNGDVAAVNEKLWWWCDDLDRKKMWDMGWYRCQDLTALNGSVVRLWDGRKRRYDAALLLDGGPI
ncbi:hypothetical protein RD792_010912 [Penstemon davidsonii]|uniref:Transmembrane protein n=1 Tax=Penstemon davidsonii TaxID=160366 RepID=A0ABR0D3C4_9LAMI|nr:hypothetical protein RD792_010912 [Penstemon davidsonii]